MKFKKPNKTNTKQLCICYENNEIALISGHIKNNKLEHLILNHHYKFDDFEKITKDLKKNQLLDVKAKVVLINDYEFFLAELPVNISLNKDSDLKKYITYYQAENANELIIDYIEIPQKRISSQKKCYLVTVSNATINQMIERLSEYNIRVNNIQIIETALYLYFKKFYANSGEIIYLYHFNNEIIIFLNKNYELYMVRRITLQAIIDEKSVNDLGEQILSTVEYCNMNIGLFNCDNIYVEKNSKLNGTFIKQLNEYLKIPCQFISNNELFTQEYTNKFFHIGLGGIMAG